MEKILWIVTEHFSYSKNTTIGNMYFEYIKDFVHYPNAPIKEFFGYTLEDTARPINVKVYGETCLPGGLECDVSLFENDHFGKTIIFHTDQDKRTIRFGPLTWTGCLAHGGNTIADTLGCVCVAKNYINRDRIQGSLKNELRTFVEQKIKEGYTIKARFINLTQVQNVPLSINLKRFTMTTQFWKGLLMAIVGVIFAAFNTPPLAISVVIVTLIGTLLVYVGTNAIKVLRPISIPSTLTWQDAVHALLILIGNGILESIGLIVTGTAFADINWIVLLRLSASIAFTYLGSTLFAGPYTTKKISWTRQARLEYTRSDRNR